MKCNDFTEIYSYDEDFDLIGDIIRIELWKGLTEYYMHNPAHPGEDLGAENNGQQGI